MDYNAIQQLIAQYALQEPKNENSDYLINKTRNTQKKKCQERLNFINFLQKNGFFESGNAEYNNTFNQIIILNNEPSEIKWDIKIISACGLYAQYFDYLTNDFNYLKNEISAQYEFRNNIISFFNDNDFKFIPKSKGINYSGYYHNHQINKKYTIMRSKKSNNPLFNYNLCIKEIHTNENNKAISLEIQSEQIVAESVIRDSLKEWQESVLGMIHEKHHNAISNVTYMDLQEGPQNKRKKMK